MDFRHFHLLLKILCAILAVSSTVFAQAPSPATSDPTVDISRAPSVSNQPNQPAPYNVPGANALPAPVSAPAGYILSANDQIAIEVFGEDDLRTAARLNAEGNMSIPLLGSIHLAGLTLTQAATRLTDLYARDYLVNPRVNVMLVGYARRRFTVLGQVSRPGSYDLPDGAPGGIDILEAIAMAGGYTRIAAPERISIKRRDQVMRVDAKKIARRGGSEGGFRVEPGDTITVGESIF